MIDIEKSAGPAYPTLSGGKTFDGTFRWEGMSIFDAYFIASIQSGKSPEEAFEIAKVAIEMRKYIFTENLQNE